MRPYEAVFVLEPTLDESAMQAVINRATLLVESRGASVNKVDKWGRRRLAYEVRNHVEGFYVLAELTSEPAAMDELERFLRLADEVLRHKIVRVPDQAGGRVLPASAVEQIAAPGPSREGREGRERRR